MIKEIEIVYDLVCPFCLIGERILTTALTELPDPPMVKRRPFILDPQITGQGVPFPTYHAAKYGERSKPMMRHLEQFAQRYGLNFNFDNLKTYPPSMDGHRLVLFAERFGASGKIATALMEAYFLENREIQKQSVLLEIAVEQGLPKDETRAMLESGDLREIIEQEVRNAQMRGIRSVPSYFVDGNYIGGTEEIKQYLVA
ncbi:MULTISPECIES: DsbA family oxidoreductase [Nostoc]|uniref:DsbA family oxidoreductase n=2 Tax=Nostoc TaxID=1177 RepID=A0ABR8IG47_9NOSO|nr:MULTISPECIES: DsbA family oxidoreductase [Nostoc]MBD2562341.1 DsbA family oxidoreductase [Nostoc linckia FACHB-391]MBD2649781.1 DsbA family oxidoreductase [Nostoc foliaceum FACHB-393]MBG1244802.1 DsbA family oxidoreductase [Nostoc sp. NZL]